MRPIIPCLALTKGAKEAARFYCSAFPRSKLTSSATLHGTPSGDLDVLTFTLGGQPFMAFDGGPYFKPNPSISFIVTFSAKKDKSARKKQDALWHKLSRGGKTLMPLAKYFFSERYGWVQDRFGVSWQLILDDSKRPPIVPSLMFTGKVAGKAEDAFKLYLKVFKPSKRGAAARYPKGGPDAGTLMYSDWRLNGQWLAAMDSAAEHTFAFDEGVSLVVPCRTQRELDAFARKLSADPKFDQCGWVKDKWGVSWQIWPTAMGEMLTKGTRAQVDRVTQAFMPMKRYDLAALKKAFAGK